MSLLKASCTRGNLCVRLTLFPHVYYLPIPPHPSSCSVKHTTLVKKMAPSAIDTEPAPAVAEITNGVKKLLSSPNKTSSLKRAPLVYSGSLDEYDSFDVTNIIGREFPHLQISDILQDDQKIRDLAILGKLILISLVPDQDELCTLTSHSFSTRRCLLPQPRPAHQRSEDLRPKTR